MKYFIFIILLVSGLFASAQQLYKIVNADGSVTYTDRPQDGAEAFDLSNTNSVVMPALNAGQQRTSSTQQQQLPDYQLSIVAPQDQATIRDNQGKVTVRAQMSPQGNGVFELHMDGTLVQSSPSPVFQLQNVVRGEHRIQVKFVHHTGKILASSAPSVFFMHQASVFINPN